MKIIAKLLTRNKHLFLYSFLLLLSITLVTIPFQSLNHGLFFSSDNFYFPALLQDAIRNPLEIPIWNLPPAPVIIPDFLIFSFSFLFSFLSPISSLSIFSLMIGILIVSFTLKIYKLLYKEKEKIINIQLWFLVTINVVLILRMLGLTHEFILPLFLTGHHGGSVLLTLILLYFLLLQYHKSRVSIWVLIFILILLGRWSDGMLLTHFILPSWIVSFFLLNKADIKFFFIWNGILLANLFIYPFKNIILKGILTIPHYQPEKLIRDGFKKNGLPVDFFLNDIELLINNFSSIELIIILIAFILLSIIVIQYSILRFKSIFSSLEDNQLKIEDPFLRANTQVSLQIDKNLFNRIFVIHFIFVSVIIQFISILAIQHYFSKDLLTATRYYSPIFFFLLITVPLTLNKWDLTNFHLISIQFLLIFSFFFSLFLYPIKSYSNPILYCIDHRNELSSIRNNSYGIADYWQAKPITVTSQNRIQVQPIWDLKPYEWVGRRRILQDGDKFQFAILGKGSRIDEHAFQKKYGEPFRKVECGDFEIYLYPNNKSF